MVSGIGRVSFVAFGRASTMRIQSPEAGVTKVELHTFGFEEDFEGSEIALEGPEQIRVEAWSAGCAPPLMCRI
jgi:hypothetical protein